MKRSYKKPYVEIGILMPSDMITSSGDIQLDNVNSDIMQFSISDELINPEEALSRQLPFPF